MIYELRTYTLLPGKQGEYLKFNGEVGRTSHHNIVAERCHPRDRLRELGSRRRQAEQALIGTEAAAPAAGQDDCARRAVHVGSVAS